jgi:L-threonylcarbamoyladenylate synthase
VELFLNTLRLSSAIAADIDLAATLLKEGGLVAVPTETVYGLAADATNAQAVSHIFTAKGRPADHPLIVHLHDASAMSRWAKDIPAVAVALADAFWPGPLTLLLKKADHVSAVVTGGLDSIGLRVPAHPVLQQLLQQHQLAVAAPSANRYKKLSPTSAQQVFQTMQGRIDAVLDGGDCEFGLESTIVSVLDDEIAILRAGPISAAELAKVVGRPVAQPKKHQVKVAGNVDAHYQPEKKLFCLPWPELLQKLTDSQQACAVLHLTALPTTLKPSWQKWMPTNALDYGQALYRELYAADQSDAEVILLEAPPSDEAWLAVQDRLARAVYPR